MRTIVDIPSEQIQQLATICQEQHLSRAQVIRQAIAQFLAQRPATQAEPFGLWKHRGQDGVDYQQALRSRVGGMKPVFDTNILIDYLNGVPASADELARYPAAAISTITWIEVMAGASNAAEEQTLRSFLTRFVVIPVDMNVAETAFILRRHHRIRLPDAIIWATARNHGTLLITRNTKDFSETEPDIRVPYRTTNS